MRTGAWRAAAGRRWSRSAWRRAGRPEAAAADGSFDVQLGGELQGTVHWDLLGEHNRHNALAALAAARHAGVPASAWHRGARTLPQRQAPPGGARHRERRDRLRRLRPSPHRDRADDRRLAQQGRQGAHPRRAGTALQHDENGRDEGQPGARACAAADLVFCYTNGIGWDAASRACARSVRRRRVTTTSGSSCRRS